jgi:Tfp pilus assembly protein PilV
MTRGFTLLEVVVALLLLEVAVLAAAGTLVVASRTLTQAELLERAVLEAEAVLDSLAATPAVTSGARPFSAGTLEWSVGPSGTVVVRAASPDSALQVEVTSSVRRW